MKAVKTVLKVLAALAAIAGVVYVIATYGDKIVAWAKKLLNSCPCKCCDCGDEPVCEECGAVEDAEAVEEAPAEQAPVAEPVAEKEAEEGAVVADEADFEG